MVISENKHGGVLLRTLQFTAHINPVT